MKELANEILTNVEKSQKIHPTNFFRDIMFSTTDEFKNKFCSNVLLFLFKQYLTNNIDKNKEQFLQKDSRIDFRSQMLELCENVNYQIQIF